MGESVKEMFVAHILPVLFSGLAMLLGWVFVKLKTLLEARAKESRLAAVGFKMASFADLVVQDIEANLKADLQAATQDGVLTPEELKFLRARAIERLKIILGQHGVKELGDVLGIVGQQAIDMFLGGMVEKAVAKLPSGPEVPAAPFAPAGEYK